MKNRSDPTSQRPEDPSIPHLENDGAYATIEPAAFTPPSGPPGGRRFKPSQTVVVAAIALLACLPIIYFLFMARSITVETTPPAEQLSIDGGLVLPVGNRYLLLPGEYKLDASAHGYYPLQEPFLVTAESSNCGLISVCQAC